MYEAKTVRGKPALTQYDPIKEGAQYHNAYVHNGKGMRIPQTGEIITPRAVDKRGQAPFLYQGTPSLPRRLYSGLVWFQS
jgi:hypothetical protein